MYQSTTAVRKLLGLSKRIRGVAGGTSASKTISIIQILINQAQTDKAPTLTSITSESVPHLKRGAMRDFLNIMQDHHYFKDDNWNRSDFTYTFETGSKIEFFSLDMPHKVRGPRRDRLFINEANNIPVETFEQLEVRTKDVIWLDWNPTREFWFYTDYKDKPNVDFMILTYKDNEALDPNIVASIESRRDNKNWWRVYGEGQLGEVEGKIYTNWKLDVEIPHEARLERRGLDFGYAHDPACLVDIYYYNGGYIVDELLFRVGMKNRQIADVILNQPDPNILTVADSAEPKSIDEMMEYGVNIMGANKGPGSVNQGIQWVQAQQISVTRRSRNIAKAYKNYMWKTDREGKILTEPDHYLSDAMDAIRYGLETFRPRKEPEKAKYVGQFDPVTGRRLD
jgi:phage terminase large subunit